MHCTLSRKGSPPPIPHPHVPFGIAIGQKDRYTDPYRGRDMSGSFQQPLTCNGHLSTGRVRALEYDLYCTNGNGFAFVKKKNKAQTAELVEHLQLTNHVNINLILI
jgi:hypothetical protein